MNNMKKYYLQFYPHSLSIWPEEEWINLSSLRIPPEIAERLAELGVVEIWENQIKAGQAFRVQKLMRLGYSLGLDLYAAAIILDLMERVELLQGEIERLKKWYGGPSGPANL